MNRCDDLFPLPLGVGKWLGLEAGDTVGESFCTPSGAHVLGWDNDIHYCLIDGFGQTVFCVNPEGCCDRYVYPIARDVRDFCRLVLAVGNTNPLQQIILWERQEFDDFLRSPEEAAWRRHPEVVQALAALQARLGLPPMEEPFAYVKALQSDFPYERIPFSPDYYDTLGLPFPG